MHLLKAHNKKSALLIFIVFALNVGAGLAVVTFQPKFIVALVSLPFVIIFWLNSTQISKIALTCVAITFPITLQFMGQDAMTTGTLLILLLFTYTWSVLNKKKISDNDSRFIFRILLILVIISIVGTVSKTPMAYYGPAVRHLLNFITSVLLFYTIVKSDLLTGTNVSRKQYVDNILTILILIVSLHIALSAVFYVFPNFQQYFSIFFHREQTHLTTHLNVQTGIFERGATVFTAGEEFGELLVVVFPFYFYKALVNKKFIVLIPIFFLGLLVSGTRSASILVLIELIIMLYITRSKKFIWKKITISFSVLILVMIVSPFFYKLSSAITGRFLVTIVHVQSHVDFSTVMNRNLVWEYAWKTTWQTLSLTGHGPIQAYLMDRSIGSNNFHCLYMTLVFQYGIIGTIFFLTFFFTLMKRMILKLKNLNKDSHLYLLTGSCILSFVAFLINELKFEFNRSDSYQQFVWIVFAVYYLTGTLLHKNNLGTH